MPRDYLPPGKEEPAPPPTPRRDFIPAKETPRGYGVAPRQDWVPAGGRPAEPEQPEPSLFPEPKEAPLLDHDFVPGVPNEPESSGDRSVAEADAIRPRLAVGTKVGDYDGSPLYVIGYDEEGRPRIGHLEPAEEPEAAGEEAGAKGGESGLVDAQGLPLTRDEEPEGEPEGPPAKKSHKKKS